MQNRRFLSRILLGIFLWMWIPLGVRAVNLDDAVFFGDSTTAHLAVRGGIPRERVWSGPKSTVLFETVNKTNCVHLYKENIDVPLREAVRRKKPALLIITIGASGGAGFLTKEQFIQVYKEMLESVKSESPSTKIVVQSIYPLSDKSVKYFKKLSKNAVNEANAWIQSLCMEMGIPYLTTGELLKNPSNGYLQEQYQSDEQLHLTSAAYAVILQHLRDTLPHLYP